LSYYHRFLQGAGIGFVCSLVAAFTLGVGAILAKNSLPILPLSTAGCADSNSTGHLASLLVTDLMMKLNGTSFNDDVILTSATTEMMMTSMATSTVVQYG
jgi:hypothetical protein